jgi:hypothetical protein
MATSSTAGAPASMTTQDFSQVIGTSAVTVIPSRAFYGINLSYMRIWNVSPTATIWCSRSGPAAVNGAGSFPLGPGLYEMFIAPASIPLNPLSIIATAVSTPVTIEVG